MRSEFVDWARSERGVAPDSLRTYLYGISKLDRAAVGDGLDIDHLDKGQLRHYIGVMYDRFSNVSTRLTIVSGIKRYYEFLQKEGVRADNPVREFRAVARHRELPRIPSFADVERFLHLPPVSETPWARRDYLIKWLLAGCAIRRGEARELRVGDVSLEERTLRVTGKGRKTRIVPLGDRLVALLKAYLEDTRPRLAQGALRRGHSPADHLLLGWKGGPLARDCVRHALGNIAKHYGVPPISPHKFRHAAARRMIVGGASLRAVQKVLGHSRVATTEVYTFMYDEEVGDQVRRANPWA